MTQTQTEQAPQVVRSTKPRVRKVKEEPVPVRAEPVPVVVEEQAPAVVEEPEQSNVKVFESRIQAIREKLNDEVNVIKEDLKNIKEKLKEFKEIDSDLKQLFLDNKKFLKQKKRKNPENNALNNPIEISNDLADFLGVAHGTSISRPKVSSLISAYANERDLKNKDNRTIFVLDKKLKKLFGEPVHLIKKNSPELGFGVSIFNLGNYLKPHFIKRDVSA
jgi:chromatin remodeling complex protein RSC6